MTIVYLTYGVPWPPDTGTRIRDSALIGGLSGLGVQVHLVCCAKDETALPDLGPLERICHSVTVFRPPARGLWRQARDLARGFAAGRPLAMHPFHYPELAGIVAERLAQTKAAILQTNSCFLIGYVDSARRQAGVRTVAQFNDLGWVQYSRMARLPGSILARTRAVLKAWLMRGWEARWAARFDLCITANPDLRVEAAENGVDCDRFALLPKAQSCDILFLGVMGYPPNADAAVFFCRNVLPRIRAVEPRARLLVVGHAPPDRVRQLSSPAVVVTGSVEDVKPYYEQSAVCIAPLRAGSGTRLKILEAMALGRPVVATTLGCEGIDVAPGVDLLVADSPEEFARDVLRLFADAALWHSLARNARAKVEKLYSWKVIAARLHREYLSLCGAPADVRTSL